MLYRLAETLDAPGPRLGGGLARPRPDRRGPRRPGAALRPRRQRPRARGAPAARGARLRAGAAAARRGARSATPSIRASPRRAGGSPSSRSASGRPSGTCSRRRCCGRTACPTPPTAASCGRRARSRRARSRAGRKRSPRRATGSRRRPRARAPASSGPTAPPSCCARSSAAAARRSEGVLDRARRLAELPALQGIDEPRSSRRRRPGELRRLATGSVLYRTGEARRRGLARRRRASSSSCARRPSATSRWARRSPGTSSARRRSSALPRTCDARARGAATLLGFTPDFFSPEPDRAAWLRYLRARLARRLARLNDLFRQFFPDDAAPPAHGPAGAPAEGGTELSLADRSRSLTTVGLGESDRFLFAVFAEEKHYPADAVIFREGDAGDAIYVIARGRVRISRQISGGEEAFAILSPGRDLRRDGAARARARAARPTPSRTRTPSCSSLPRARFEALEAADPEGCAELSLLLCRLAARRSVETAERLASWRVLAGPG